MNFGRATWGVAAAAALGLTACTQTDDPTPIDSGGSAGESGPGYCDSPPADPAAQERWENLCFPDDNR